MKQQMKNNSTSLFLALAFIVNLLLPFAVYAQSDNDLTKPQVAYIGKANGQPVVQVNYANTGSASCKIILQDPEGNVLYAAQFNQKDYQKKFLIDHAGIEDIQLTIILYTGATRHTQVVRINSTSFSDQSFTITKN